MTVTIGRRELLVAVGGAVAAWPLAARGAEPRPRIAVLSINSEQDESKNIAAFVDGLRALGYVSQNVDIDYRYAEGDTTRLKPLAQELIALKPNVAFANSPSPAVAVQSLPADQRFPRAEPRGDLCAPGWKRDRHGVNGGGRGHQTARTRARRGSWFNADWLACQPCGRVDGAVGAASRDRRPRSRRHGADPGSAYAQ